MDGKGKPKSTSNSEEVEHQQIIEKVGARRHEEENGEQLMRAGPGEKIQDAACHESVDRCGQVGNS